MMPPHVRDIERVTRFEIGDFRLSPRLGEARKAREVGMIEIDQADRGAADRQVERPRIQHRQAVRREQGKAPPSADIAGDIQLRIVMGLGACRIADPQPGGRRGIQQTHGMRLDKARKMLRRHQGLGDRRLAFAGRRTAIGMLDQPVEQKPRGLRKAFEVKAGQAVIIEKSAANLRSAHQHLGVALTGQARQITRHGRRPFRRPCHDRPILHQSAQDGRPIEGPYLLRKHLGIDIIEDRDGARGCGH